MRLLLVRCSGFFGSCSPSVTSLALHWASGLCGEQRFVTQVLHTAWGWGLAGHFEVLHVTEPRQPTPSFELLSLRVTFST